jgi:hypothetical protein
MGGKKWDQVISYAPEGRPWKVSLSGKYSVLQNFSGFTNGAN